VEQVATVPVRRNRCIRLTTHLTTERPRRQPLQRFDFAGPLNTVVPCLPASANGQLESYSPALEYGLAQFE
jgi:hypothetical protein